MASPRDTRVTRRRFGMTAGCALASVAFGEACLVATRTSPGSDGRLTARPSNGVVTSLRSGALGLGSDGRDGVMQMPSAPAAGKVPLLVFLHGATQNGAGMLRRIGPAADQAGVAVLAPDSRGTTWDAIRDGFGDDVVFLNRALEYVFARLAVDPARVALGGFSDGASYAISLGLANGDLFPRRRVLSGFVISAAPPGVRASSSRTGRPIRFFRSINAAASSCRGFCQWATTSRSASSTAVTKCRPTARARACGGAPRF
jgi:poly(3-hydroxybutyrate) depolymerase